jgi:hypothetical protein
MASHVGTERVLRCLELECSGRASKDTEILNAFVSSVRTSEGGPVKILANSLEYLGGNRRVWHVSLFISDRFKSPKGVWCFWPAFKAPYVNLDERTLGHRSFWSGCEGSYTCVFGSEKEATAVYAALLSASHAISSA